MKRIWIILLATGCLLTGTAAGYAQQRTEGTKFRDPVSTPELSAKTRVAADELFYTPRTYFNVEWLREEVNPILRERREIRRMMEVRAQGAVQTTQNPAPVQTPHATANNWQFSLGNTSVSNWSFYPDRMLDARTLSFPMRCDSKAGK